MQATGTTTTKKLYNKSGHHKKQWKPRTNGTKNNVDDIKSIQQIVGDGFTAEYIKMVLMSVDGRVEIAVNHLLNEIEKSSTQNKPSNADKTPINTKLPSMVEINPTGKAVCIVLKDNKEHINTRFAKPAEELFERIWVNLPTELVQEILGYCDLIDAGILLQVCKHWNHIISWSDVFWTRMWKENIASQYPESSRAKGFFKNEYLFVRSLLQRTRKCSKCHKEFYDFDNQWMRQCTANALKVPQPHTPSGPFLVKNMMEVRCRQPSRAFRLLREFMKSEVGVPHTVDVSTKWHGSDKDIFFSDPNTGVELSDIMDIFHYLIGVYGYEASTVSTLSKWLDTI